MIVKTVIEKDRIRKIPRSFSWVDHRLVREHHIEKCSHAQSALYLFLICVADDKGLSYYGDPALMEKLNMDQSTLDQAREGLVHNRLIAWQKPIYQVLSLEPVTQGTRGGSMVMVSQKVL